MRKLNFSQLVLLGLVIGLIFTISTEDIWVSITFIGVYGIAVWVLQAVYDFMVVIGYKLQKPQPTVFDYEIYVEDEDEDYYKDSKSPRHPDPTRPGPDEHNVIDISHYRRKA